jgi:hypothetical protein
VEGAPADLLLPAAAPDPPLPLAPPLADALAPLAGAELASSSC